MKAYVALVRAVNVGGRKLLMNDLKSIAEELGLERARTYIASGNLLFVSSKAEAELRSSLEKRLAVHLGKAVGVMVRAPAELEKIVKNNPFADQPGNRVVAIFLNEPPPSSVATSAKNLADERIALGRREIYVHYPSGQGRSKLQIPGAANGTARNMNTVAKLAELAKEIA